MKKKLFGFLSVILPVCFLFSGCRGLSDYVLSLLNSKCDEQISYFDEIALYSKDGSPENAFIMRWETPVRIKIEGDYTGEDLSTVRYLVDLLNSIDNVPEVSISDDHPNFHIYFIPKDEIPSKISTAEQGDWCRSAIWDNDCSIFKVDSGIASDVTSQKDRNYLILQQMVSSLGFLNNSDKDSDSLFSSKWAGLESLNEKDAKLIRMLYLPSIKPGMNKTQAEDILRSWLKAQYMDSGYLD